MKKISHKTLHSKSSGFTMIELVAVIVVLGVLSIMVSGFIRFGTQIYLDASNRDDLTASARFAVERLNREIRNALPNSIRINEDTVLGKQCLEFVPIEASVVYLDIPVFPEAVSNTITVFSGNTELDDASNGISLNQVAVYVLNESEIYGGASNKVYNVNSLSNSGPANEFELTLNNSVHFAEDSPTNRLFFINPPVSYCVQDTQAGGDATHVENLTRHTGYGYGTNNIPDNAGVVMAKFVRIEDGAGGYNLPFSVTQKTQERNSIVLADLQFTRNFENIVFNNEIQVPNVP